MRLLALSCSKNHLFVCLASGGRSSVYGTDPHFDSASGALPWWRSRTHSGGRMVGVLPSDWFVSLLGRSVPVHAASAGEAALSAARTWPHQGAHSGRAGRQRSLRRRGALGAQGRLCDPASTVVQPRPDVDDGGNLGLPRLPNKATQFAGSAACRVRRDDLVHACPPARTQVRECPPSTKFSLRSEPRSPGRLQ